MIASVMKMRKNVCIARSDSWTNRRFASLLSCDRFPMQTSFSHLLILEASVVCPFDRNTDIMYTTRRPNSIRHVDNFIVYRETVIGRKIF